MGTIWNRDLNSLTQGANMRAVVIKSSARSLCATLATFPYFHRLALAAAEGGRFPKGFEYWEFMSAELFLLFLLCLLSAVIGFSFSKRFGLPGIGVWRNLPGHLPALLILGAAIIALSYWVFDRRFAVVSPMSYPKDALSLLCIPFKGALTEETVLRLCLVKLCVGFLRSKIRGVIAASAFTSLFAWKYFQFVGVAVGFNYLFMAHLGLSFLVNLVLGYLFVREGLIYAMALKFILGIKYVVMWWAAA